MQALQGHSEAAYAGRVPAGMNKTNVDARGMFHSEDDIRNLMVDVTQAGVPVYLKDLATVNRVYEDPSQYVPDQWSEVNFARGAGARGQ